jgi:hypothetical protein
MYRAFICPLASNPFISYFRYRTRAHGTLAAPVFSASLVK